MGRRPRRAIWRESAAACRVVPTFPSRSGEKTARSQTIVRNLTRSQGGLDEYDEVWIVVDHDGKDRQGFLEACRRVRGTRMVGIVSTPCFEVWLNAHYERVQKYRDQEALHAADRTHRGGG